MRLSFRATVLALGLAAFAAPGLAGNGAPASCPDRAAATIGAPASAGLKCQQAIAKNGAKFLKAKTAALSKCLFKSAPGSCPAAADTAKIEAAALKATAKIAKACGDDAAQAALGSSYKDLTDDAVISSCTLSQHNALADVLVLNATGISTEDWPGVDNQKGRSKCVAEASKTGIGLGLDILAAASKCIDKQIKAGAAGDLASVCVGSLVGGNFVAPTDAKTAAKLGKLISSAQSRVGKKCGPGEGSWLPSVFACDGAETAAELAACLTCQGFHSAVDFLEHQYAEDGVFVENGPEAIQNAVEAATPGTKLLIEPGDYEDDVSIESSDLALVGCGGATNDRPRIVKPASCGDPGDCDRGIEAVGGFDDLSFQSLEVHGWTSDGIFVAGVPEDDDPPTPADPSQRILFRDIIGDGGNADPESSRYAVFPVHSSDVLIETCNVRDISDAGIYVGQSDGLLVRFNKITTSVAGIEFENSGHGVGHNNYATGNTGGLLVFKDGSLPVQLSNDHRVAHNLFVDNNGPNYGSGNVAGVPEGTGVLLISDDDGVYEYNVITGNDSFGVGLIDQYVAQFNVSEDPEDIKATGASVRNNVVTGNGSDPDDEAPFPGDMLMVLQGTHPPGTPLEGTPVYGDPAVHNNCFTGNLVDQDPIFLGVENQCP